MAYITGGQLDMTSNRGVGSRRDFALATAVPAITTVHLEQGEQVEVVITGPSGIVSQGNIVPGWGEYFSPNGPECGPQCRTAPPQTLLVELPAVANE